MRQYSRLLPNFRFRFRLRASFRGGSVFRDPLCTGTGTSRNHFASRCDIFDGSPTFWRRNRSRSESRWQSNYCRSSRCKARASGTTVSPWINRGFICSVSMIGCGPLPEKLLSIGSGTQFNHGSLCWRSCGIRSGPMFHVLKTLLKGRKFNAQYYIII
jgi:hypothetical protein